VIGARRTTQQLKPGEDGTAIKQFFSNSVLEIQES